MMRVAVKIAYLGEEYSGSQIQPGFPTVEGDVLSDLRTILKLSDDELDLRLASRTDRGVNALGNVIVFNTAIEDPRTLLKALNAVSKGIFYRSLAHVDDSFNPRYADRRLYRYVIPSANMDIERIKECAALFSGEHDLSRFCRADGKDTVLTLDPVSVSTNGDLIFIDFSARYYLWNLIRRITAAIMSVGSGVSEISDVQRALEGEDITFGLARPDALTLVDVVYDGLEFVSYPDILGNRPYNELFSIELKEQFYKSL